MVTIVIPISRVDYLQRLFESLENLECNKYETNLLVYVHGDLTLFEKARNLTGRSKFAERLCVFRKKGRAHVGSILRRRQTIADIHNELKGMIVDCDYIFLIEDDTLVPSHALKSLLAAYKVHPEAGFISGIELGRWGYLHIGAWDIETANEVKTITSIPNGEGLRKVDAAGFYCCLMPKLNYIGSFYEPYDNILGPDVNFGLNLRRMGYENFVDYGVKCIHMDKKADVTVDQEIVQVEFSRTANGKWQMATL